MSENKTQPTAQSVDAFLAGVDNPRRRAQGQALLPLFERASQFPARMWGESIVGFGRYAYRYESGRTGQFLATGYAPRKAAISIYIMPGYANFDSLLARLGPHKTGKSCLYITRLDAVDLSVLEELIRAGLADLAKYWPVLPE